MGVTERVPVWTTAALAIILIGGTVAGWLVGKDPPQWLTGFDGAIVLAAFAHGAFFAQARAAAPTAIAAQDLRDKYHQLSLMAMSSATGPTTTTITTPATTTDPSPQKVEVKTSGNQPTATE